MVGHRPLEASILVRVQAWERRFVLLGLYRWYRLIQCQRNYQKKNAPLFSN